MSQKDRNKCAYLEYAKTEQSVLFPVEIVVYSSIFSTIS